MNFNIPISSVCKGSMALRPISISNCNLKNRMGLGPINTGFFRDDGNIDDKFINFYDKYSKSGLGLLYIGGVAVSQNGRSNCGTLVLNSHEKSIGIRKIISLVHSNYVKVVVQLMHAGRQTDPDEIGSPIVAPSAIPCPIIRKIPNELSLEGIYQLITSFGKSALLSEISGADIIEIHAAHGYLISSFLSPNSNKRSDKYGGSLKNRFRILIEMLEEISSLTSIPIGIRVNCKENVPNGLRIEDLVKGITNFLKRYISYVSVTAGTYSDRDMIIPSRRRGNAIWQKEAGYLRERVKLPIFLSGNIDSLSLAEFLIRNKKADVILMVRSLLADPNFLLKSILSKEKAILQCTDCRMCKYHSAGKKTIYCPQNPMISS